MNVSVILFEDFQDLDVFGSVAVFGCLKDYYQICFRSMRGGLVKGSSGAGIITSPVNEVPGDGIVLIPGGFGTRAEVHDVPFIDELRRICTEARFVLTVCTGSALLAHTGLLDGRRATSNKRSFVWVREQSSAVEWVPKARWVVDGKYYSSSGVTAGIDMTLGFVSDMHGEKAASGIASGIEHIRHENRDDDPFAVTV